MVLVCFWYGFGMCLVWCWCVFEMFLVCFWYGSGMVVGMVLLWFCNGFAMVLVWLWYGFAVFLFLFFQHFALQAHGMQCKRLQIS